jgi:hypothetical protein
MHVNIYTQETSFSIYVVYLIPIHKAVYKKVKRILIISLYCLYDINIKLWTTLWIHVIEKYKC